MGRTKLAALQLAQKEGLEEVSKSLIQDTQQRVALNLRKLCPFLDEEETVRLKDRLRLSGLTAQVKHPIFLSKHLLVVMMLRKAHEDSFHDGTEYVRNILKEEFLIIGLRNALWSFKYKCGKCRKNAAQSIQLEMADLSRKE